MMFHAGGLHAQLIWEDIHASVEVSWTYVMHIMRMRKFQETCVISFIFKLFTGKAQLGTHRQREGVGRERENE